MSEVDEERIYLNEWIVDDWGRNKKPYNPIRKSKDTFVFLKDYKPRITDILTRLHKVECHLNYYIKMKAKIAKEFRRRGKERKRLLNERMEKLEKEVYDLKNPPLNPELQNPFD